MSGTITRIGATGAGALLALGIIAAAPPAGATGSHGHTQSGQSAACFTASGHTQGKSHSDPDGMSNGGADKPGCTGGFDADRDGNNGCGNDADREDDNNGHCGRPKAQRTDDHRAAKAAVDAKDQGRDDGRCQGHPASSTTTATAGPTVSGATVAGASSQKCSCALGSEGTFTTPATASAGAAGKGTAVGTEVKAQSATPTAGATVAGSDLSLAVAGTTADVAGTTAGATAGTDQAAVDATALTPAPDTQVLGETLSRPSALARTGAGIGAMALLGGLLCGGGRLALLARRLLRIG